MDTQIVKAVDLASSEARGFRVQQNAHLRAAQELKNLASSSRRQGDNEAADSYFSAALIHDEKAQIYATAAKAIDGVAVLLSAVLA